MPDPAKRATGVNGLSACAVVFDSPEALSLRELAIDSRQPGQALVDVEWSGISTGTERLLWRGDMPPFPGMGYPLVPGYETVGRVVDCDPGGSVDVGDRVFVSGARCYREVRGLFGGAASRVVVDETRLTRVGGRLGEEAILLALAATAYHAAATGRRPRRPGQAARPARRGARAG